MPALSWKRRPHSLFDRVVGGPVGFRELLERLGPTFIKLGQFLALRPDLVDQVYCDELLKLVDRVQPFSWSDAERTIREELGGSPATLFQFINPHPLAAGSLAQTHLARLHDGTEVVVKVLRPNIAERVRRDLRRVAIIARLLEMAGVSAGVSPREVVQELTSWMIEEINLGNELANLQRLYKLAASSAIERIPRAFPDLCSSRVLTTQYLRGVRFSQLVLTSGDGEDGKGEDQAGPDREKLAENLLRATLTQIFRYSFFHADLHPGNLIALPDNVVGFVDFGLCDVLDETVRGRQTKYMAAVYNRDIDAMFKALSDLLVPSETTDMEAFRMEFFGETRRYFSQPERVADRANERSPIAHWMVQVVRSARGQGLRFPPNVLSMYRALLSAESVARMLSSRVNLRVIGSRFFKEVQCDEILHSLDSDRSEQLLLNVMVLLRDWPAQMQRILSDLSSGQLAFEVRSQETKHDRWMRNHRARLIAAAILSVALAVLLASPGLPQIRGISVAVPLGLVEAGVVFLILSYWRKLGK